MNEATYHLALAALRSIADDIDPTMREHARAVLQNLAALASGFADDIDGYTLCELISARNMAGSSSSALVKFVDGVLALRESYIETKRGVVSTATREALASHILAVREACADLRKRSEHAAELADNYSQTGYATDAQRCRGKASAYKHAADLIESCTAEDSP